MNAIVECGIIRYSQLIEKVRTLSVYLSINEVRKILTRHINNSLINVYINWNKQIRLLTNDIGQLRKTYSKCYYILEELHTLSS